jgi:16S rRNA (cytidine1402-2'-O)-methyltransferase
VEALALSALDPEPFLFLGFLPATRKERFRRLEEFAPVQATLVLFEAPHRVRETLAELYEVLGDRRVAICRELTKLHEQVIRTRLSRAVTEVPERGEFTLVVEKARPPEPPSHADATARLKEMLAQGFTRKDAVEQVSGELALSHREVYKLALSINSDE